MSQGKEGSLSPGHGARMLLCAGLQLLQEESEQGCVSVLGPEEGG